MPFMSVIVPAYNEGRYIGKCLEALKKQTFKDFEIIVVDGGSSDKTVEIARKYTKKIVFDKKGGFAEAKNTGARAARGKLLVFTDADTIVPINWLEKIDENFKNGGVALGGIMKIYDGRPLDNIIWYVCANLLPRITSFFGFYMFPSTNCAYKRENFFKARGFNKRMGMCDDTEFSNRIKKLGKVFFDKNLVVYTSCRRPRKRGYRWVFGRYLLAYLCYFSGMGTVDIDY